MKASLILKYLFAFNLFLKPANFFSSPQVFQQGFSPVTKISSAVSSKIKTLNFIGIVCVMYIHSFNEEPVYLQAYTRPKESTFSVAIQFFLAAASLRFVVPFFFMVSGYLFFLCKVTPTPLFFPSKAPTMPLTYIFASPTPAQPDDIPNVQFSRRIRARIWSVLVPFFAWQLIAIFIVLLLLLWPAYKTNWPYYNQLQAHSRLASFAFLCQPGVLTNRQTQPPPAPHSRLSPSAQSWNLLDCIKYSFLQPPAFQLWYEGV